MIFTSCGTYEKNVNLHIINYDFEFSKWTKLERKMGS